MIHTFYCKVPYCSNGTYIVMYNRTLFHMLHVYFNSQYHIVRHITQVLMHKTIRKHSSKKSVYDFKKLVRFFKSEIKVGGKVREGRIVETFSESRGTIRVTYNSLSRQCVGLLDWRESRDSTTDARECTRILIAFENVACA